MFQIGVITPYRSQVDRLYQHFYVSSTVEHDQVNLLEIDTVDAFQGREKDIIIISCVRSNTANKIGFLMNPKRLNVAITRAKYGLIFVGNVYVLKTNELWSQLIQHYNEKGVIMHGIISEEKMRLTNVNLDFDEEDGIQKVIMS